MKVNVQKNHRRYWHVVYHRIILPSSANLHKFSMLKPSLQIGTTPHSSSLLA
jgi:hypothetical protein